MIIVPEIETVVILVPRTGSGSLYRALLHQYPRAMPIYRHMEADGIPLGYSRWRRVGVLRHPTERLWSLYKFLKTFHHADATDIEIKRKSVERPFSDWIVNNNVSFCDPYDYEEGHRFFPRYTLLHPIPETRKSQYIYLRPDLGTEIYRFEEDLEALWIGLGLRADSWKVFNKSTDEPVGEITAEAAQHLQKFFAWDFSHYPETERAAA